MVYSLSIPPALTSPSAVLIFGAERAAVWMPILAIIKALSCIPRIRELKSHIPFGAMGE
jgi:hypothetical protein